MVLRTSGQMLYLIGQTSIWLQRISLNRHCMKSATYREVGLLAGSVIKTDRWAADVLSWHAGV